MINIEKRLDFHNLRVFLEENCLFDPGKERVDEMSWMQDHDEIKLQLKLTDELLKIITAPDSAIRRIGAN